jgi:hypothetical protein
VTTTDKEIIPNERMDNMIDSILEANKTMTAEWHTENDKPEPVRKALKYIKQQKERLGIK